MYTLRHILQRLVNAVRTGAGGRAYAYATRATLALAFSLFSIATHAAFTITSTSSPTFYTDTSVSPNLVCNYQSFSVTSTTAVTDAWAGIGSFTGPLGLGGSEDGKHHLGSFTAGQTKAAFFYLCSSFTGSTTTGGYSVTIYDRDPALSGPVTLGGPTGFTVGVDNTTIQAATNVVNVIFSGPNPGVLGGTITMTVQGNTGTIGNSPGPNGPLSFTPAAYTNWRADAYELIGTNITLSGGNSLSVDNTLYISTLSGGSNTTYTATYSFRATSTTATTTSLSPVGYIASGTQIKHTDTTKGAYGSGLLPILPPSNTVSLIKLVSAATLPAQGGRVTYTVRLMNSGADPVTLDSIVDALPAGVSYVAGSSSYAGIAIPDPIVSGGSRIWSSSFSVPASGTRDLIFQADLPATPGSYVNSVTGRIGSTVIDTTLSTNDNVPGTATTLVLQAPVIAKAFSPSALAVNGVSVLTLTLTNPNAAQTLSEIAFTDNFPAGLVRAATPNAATTCSGVAPTTTANSIAISGVTLAAGASCTVTVNVTSTAAGTYNNNNVTVTSTNGGTGNTASASVIFTTLPTINKAYSAPTIALNGTVTMTLTIANNGATPLTAVAFTDTYPVNLVNAATPNLTNTCGGTATGAAGAGTLTLNGGAIPASGTCTLTIAVTSGTAGVYNNTTSGVSSNIGTGPVSNTATLTVMSRPTVAKAFNLSTIGRGQTSDLTITLSNANAVAISGVAFTDTYPANLVNAATPAAATTCGGSVTANAGAGTVALSGGVIPANGSCTITVSVTSNVVNTAPGYVNTIAVGGVTSTNAGSNAVAGSATLIVNATPTITKSFAVNTATGITTMTLTIANNHTAGISGLSFSDTFPFSMSVDTTPTLTNSCGGAVTGGTAGSTSLSLSGGAIAGASPATCAISVRVRVNTGGVFNNQTTGVSITGPFAATGSLSNVATLIAPIMTKTFTPNTVGPNGISRMEIQITNPSGTVALTGLTLTDSYPAGDTNTSTFMVNAPTPNLSSTCGGTATAAAGTSTLTLTGGALAAGQTCVIGVDVRANPGSPDTYYNATGTVRSNQGVGGTAADALYIVNRPTITKSFLTTPVTLSGGTATSVMRIVIKSNHTAVLNGISLTDVFPITPSQMVYMNTVSNGCGGTLTNQAGAALVAGTSTGIRLSAVTLAAGASCTLDITVRVSASGAYDNQTSGATATTSGFTSPGPQSNVATLVANLATPTATKSFSASQFAVNATVTLTITLTNPNTAAVTGVTFTDTYPGTMVNAATPALTNTCAGSATAAAGTNSLALAAGTIPASSSCTLTVVVSASTAGALTNSTGAITTGNAGTIAAASANVTVAGSPALTFTKSAVPLCDPFNFSTNPKNIPGAYVRYQLTVSNAAGAAGSATLTSLGDALDLNLNFDPDLRTGSVSACAASAPENAAGRGFKLSCSGGTRACNTPVFFTSAADTDAMGVSGTSLTMTFGDGPAGTKALPAEAGYAAGELKPGESVTIRFNAIVK